MYDNSYWLCLTSLPKKEGRIDEGKTGCNKWFSIEGHCEEF